MDEVLLMLLVGLLKRYATEPYFLEKMFYARRMWLHEYVKEEKTSWTITTWRRLVDSRVVAAVAIVDSVSRESEIFHLQVKNVKSACLFLHYTSNFNILLYENIIFLH